MDETPDEEVRPAEQEMPDGSSSADHRRRVISEKVQQRYELVPEIGTRWRWYDIPYRALDRCHRALPRKSWLWWLRRRLVSAKNLFMTFEQLERARVEPLDDPQGNLVVPADFDVQQGGFWVVELFTPSQYASLKRSLRRNGWGSAHHVVFDGTTVERVRRAREGRGFSWSRLGEVARPNSPHLVPDAKRESLPPEFDMVSLTAIQVGTSLTAIVAYFTPSELGQVALNSVLHQHHEPHLISRGLRRPHVLQRRSACIRATQLERQGIHDVARHWLSRRCPGFFAGTDSGQPVIDFSVFASFDPASEVTSRELRDVLRALGMDHPSSIENYVSPQMPGAVLVPVFERTSSPDKPLRNCWGVLGSHARLSEFNDQQGNADHPVTATTLGFMFRHHIQNFGLYVAVMEYFDQVRAQQSKSLDLAVTRHGRFSPRRLRKLRGEVLTAGLDLPTVLRDAATIWDSRRLAYEIEVNYEPAPGVPESRFRNPRGDLIAGWWSVYSDVAEELLAADEAYRTALSTASSLGASADTTRTSRLALVVAAASLVVAAASLLLT